MITFSPSPTPVVTELGEGYLLYVESSGQWENDIWTIVMCDSGAVKHFNTSQVKIHHNATFDIKK